MSDKFAKNFIFLVYLEICGGDNDLFKFFIVPKETMVSLGIPGHLLNLDAPFILILFVAPRNDWDFRSLP